MTLTSETEYRQAFQQLDRLLAEMGDDPEKQAQARQWAEEIQAYEQAHVPFPEPTTLASMVALKMHQRKLSTQALATLLDVPPPLVSDLLEGNYVLDFELAKKLHEHLGIDGNFILEAA